MLEKYFISLSRDEQGCHIIKKMLPRLSDAKAVAFLEHITESLLDLSTHQNGIIVVRSHLDIDKGTGEQGQGNRRQARTGPELSGEKLRIAHSKCVRELRDPARNRNIPPQGVR